MSMKSILAALAGAIVLFLLGWLFFGILLMDFYQENMTQYEGIMKEMPNLWLIFLANFLIALLVSFIFDRWANIRSFMRGLSGALIITLPIFLAFDLWIISGMNLFPPYVLLVDVIVNTFMAMVMGGVIAWILGMGEKQITNP